MAIVIVWALFGMVILWFLHDLPADPKVADKTQWTIHSKPLRILLRLSMLIAGPIWAAFILVNGIYLGSVWILKLFWRTLTK
ncbi:MAG: hypothetical protein ACRCUJ_14555 [Phocaeicola sp.]